MLLGLLIKVARSTGINVYNEERGENMFDGHTTAGAIGNKTLGANTQVQPMYVQSNFLLVMLFAD